MVQRIKHHRPRRRAYEKTLKHLKKLTAQKQAMDETEYLLSSKAMADVIRQDRRISKKNALESLK